MLLDINIIKIDIYKFLNGNKTELNFYIYFKIFFAQWQI